MSVPKPSPGGNRRSPANPDRSSPTLPSASSPAGDQRRNGDLPEAARESGGGGPRSDEDTRWRILTAAGPVFASHGFERATVRHLCRAADVNVAAIGYYFGDKMGLYLEVIRRVRARRESQFPLPDDSSLAARERLYRRIYLLLSRMMIDAGEPSWEAQLMMREMHEPTVAFDEMVQQYFRPLFVQLNEILACLFPPQTPDPILHQMAFSVVGQCLYHRIGGTTVRAMIPGSERDHYFNIESLARHITAVTLAAAEGGRAEKIAAALPAPDNSFFYPAS